LGGVAADGGSSSVSGGSLAAKAWQQQQQGICFFSELVDKRLITSLAAAGAAEASQVDRGSLVPGRTAVQVRGWDCEV
jgi:hypothetical protein